MQDVGPISDILSIDEGEDEKPQMSGPGILIRIEVQTPPGLRVLLLTQKAAAKLVQELGTYLKTHGKG
jgi:hypothetical protein